MNEILTLFAVALPAFLYLLVFLLLFLLLRGLVLWYWKVNRVISSLEKLYDLHFALHLEELQTKQVLLYDKNTQKEKQMSIKKYLEQSENNRNKYKFH
jgi:hypothetical protein